MVSRPFVSLVLLSTIWLILGQFWILCATYMPREHFSHPLKGKISYLNYTIFTDSGKAAL